MKWITALFALAVFCFGIYVIFLYQPAAKPIPAPLPSPVPTQVRIPTVLPTTTPKLTPVPTVSLLPASGSPSSPSGGIQF